MSELKSVKQSDVMWGHWYTEYYLKTEADKVIAEKDTKIIQLKALIENYNRISREIIDNANYHKHRRCLDKAKLCERLCFEFKDLFYSTSHEELEHAYNTKIEHYAKWNKRWLELAEKFKPKSTAQ